LSPPIAGWQADDDFRLRQSLDGDPLNFEPLSWLVDDSFVDTPSNYFDSILLAPEPQPPIVVLPESPTAPAVSSDSEPVTAEYEPQQPEPPQVSVPAVTTTTTEATETTAKRRPRMKNDATSRQEHEQFVLQVMRAVYLQPINGVPLDAADFDSSIELAAGRRSLSKARFCSLFRDLAQSRIAVPIPAGTHLWPGRMGRRVLPQLLGVVVEPAAMPAPVIAADVDDNDIDITGRKRQRIN